MQRIMLKSKLHRATVTDTQMDYEGSIEIDAALMDEVGIIPYEQVHIYNINTGDRFITYAIPAPRGSKTVSLNGAAARLAQRNDRIIIAAYGIINPDSEKAEPKVALLDERNDLVRKSPSSPLKSDN
ncbi:MAG: aspartate 1-decarboxylase, partial [Nitrospinaceae bacterium]|nr:aspartate 1-decarboxylase [Nitrospinaceae bacterium]NIR56473.1 aspartate 1-decarboxylase [Nitrospinaceae bacterium]NIS86934.1 aspartate 1-decarboxylase [Nitrospinaceae bacterium]NIT83772.1 aspartate 1-decarboxylase [Nitrospinaceae bacterium]NIU45975.1 aspartate 1-decarboxylase [Nitrospinaceae bacterium]